jgi:hypothetical protein
MVVWVFNVPNEKGSRRSQSCREFSDRHAKAYSQARPKHSLGVFISPKLLLCRLTHAETCEHTFVNLEGFVGQLLRVGGAIKIEAGLLTRGLYFD